MKGDVIEYRKGYKYSLWEEYQVQTDVLSFEVHERLFSLTPDGWLNIHEDYPWDGPSGPTIDSSSSIRASLVHDVFAEMQRLGLIPHDPCFHLANVEFHKILLEDKMWEWRAKIWYNAVEAVKSYATLKPENIIKAP